MRTSVKRALGAGIVGGIAFAAWRAWNARAPKRTGGVEWSTAPFPFPPAPRPSSGGRSPVGEVPRDDGPAGPAKEAGTSVRPAWVEPADDGTCPDGYPIKAKLKSGIYHTPDGANYARTKPDRCYADESAAIADGLRHSKV